MVTDELTRGGGGGSYRSLGVETLREEIFKCAAADRDRDRALAGRALANIAVDMEGLEDGVAVSSFVGVILLRRSARIVSQGHNERGGEDQRAKLTKAMSLLNVVAEGGKTDVELAAPQVARVHTHKQRVLTPWLLGISSRRC